MLLEAELSEVRESSRKTSQKEPCKEPARTPARNPARTPCTSWGVNKPPDEKPGGDSPPPQVHGRSFRRLRKLNSRPRPCPISAVLWSRPHGACDQHRRVGKAITSPIAGTTGARPEPGPARSATSGRQMRGEWMAYSHPTVKSNPCIKANPCNTPGCSAPDCRAGLQESKNTV